MGLWSVVYLLLCLGPMEMGEKTAVGKSWARDLGGIFGFSFFLGGGGGFSWAHSLLLFLFPFFVIFVYFFFSPLVFPSAFFFVPPHDCRCWSVCRLWVRSQ